MKTDETEKLETIKRLTANCLRTLKPAKDKSSIHNAHIRFYDYYELASVIRNLMKLCIIALDHDTAEVPETVKDQSIDIGLILGIALQLFPIDEFELINELSYMFPLKETQEKNSDAEHNEDVKEESV
jgi:hypothetical protein